MANEKKIEISFELSPFDMKLIRKSIIYFYNDLLTSNTYEVGEREKLIYIKRLHQLEQELIFFE